MRKNSVLLVRQSAMMTPTPSAGSVAQNDSFSVVMRPCNR